MKNKKILNLTPEELDFFVKLYNYVYTSLADCYIGSGDYVQLKKLNDLTSKIDEYIVNNI